jgi:hypothetical protein
MLTCHPRITIPPECGFALWLRPRWGDWTSKKAADPGEVFRFVEDVVASRKFETWHVTGPELVDAITRAQPASYADLVRSVYGAYIRHVGRSGGRWGDKNNWYIQQVADIRDLFPDSVLVHVVRDGRDVACSYLELATRRIDSVYAPRLPQALEAIADEWIENVSRLRAAFGAERWRDVIEIRYEDLVADPTAALTRLVRGLGEEFHPDMLDYAARNAQQELEPKEFLQWKGRTVSAPDPGQVGRHRRDLAPADVEMLTSRMRSLLEQYGYTGGPWPG